uniref:Uncharacterized protein n=1 Tax=Utricularia reniformis TaxID=192314 RepID=A0A1Y0B3U3_9LAMI|nr:hypothetical protein AEK19_MT1914 [Utricularia reniformis]ART32081.1 hypothetical protein AEK19_MT1914 [Utricularia reniformis]
MRPEVPRWHSQADALEAGFRVAHLDSIEHHHIFERKVKVREWISLPAFRSLIIWLSPLVESCLNKGEESAEASSIAWILDSWVENKINVVGFDTVFIISEANNIKKNKWELIYIYKSRSPRQVNKGEV